MTDRDQLCINTLRFLSIDMVEKARSGHPGAPMGMAAMAYALWQLHLMHNPNQPRWINRDRFVLSAGHASALLYSLLHVYGYPIMIEDLTRFRQLGSITPGHPECNPDLGIETTTGPLGQGLANGVGMAIAERWLAGRYNRPGFEIIDHLTYVIASDGDMMEGVTSEAASMAGTLKLGKLVVLYDDNRVTIEGSTSITFCEDVGARFEAYGWQVIGPLDGMDFNSVDAALKAARENINQPSLIICRTEIGYGSPGKAGTAAAHGEPLGQSEAELTRRSLGWEYPLFTVPEAARSRFAEASQRNLLRYQQWQQLYQEYSRRYGQEFQQLQAGLQSKWLPDWDNSLDCLLDDMQKPMATREASGMVLNAIGDKLISLIGGSADLAPSTKTVLKGKGEFSSRQHSGRNLHFGVREHAMGAIANGISLHGGVLPYIATFLIFYDYMRPPVRLAAMMKLPVIYIFTHDSVGLGEDGPTHQPIEQLMGLRLVPNLVTLRPADAFETLEAWKLAVSRKEGPTALVLSRQKLPLLDGAGITDARGLTKGAYVLWEDSNHDSNVIIIATGSEVWLAVSAARKLQSMGISARVVSMPSWELFEAQSSSYRNQVLPPAIKKRISIEAGRTTGWQKYIGENGIALGVDRFGISAPWEQVYNYFGLTVENIVKCALGILEEN